MTQKLEHFALLSIDEQVDSLTACVTEILNQYDFTNFKFESINHEYNSTFKVLAGDGRQFALRVNINSDRSIKNLNAEIFWVNSINSVHTPKPIANRAGDYVTNGWHEATSRTLSSVLYSWLDGVEPGDDATIEQVRAMGVAMAHLHKEALGLQLPSNAELPVFDDFFWGFPDLLTGEDSELNSAEKSLIAGVMGRVKAMLAEHWQKDTPRPIHGDMHPSNVMWNEGDLAVFDFDDSGIGLPVQDLMTTLYYLDTQEQDEAFLAGYASVLPVPVYRDDERQLFMLQRRIGLLNYLYETTNPEHREMIPTYQEETFRRIRLLDSRI